MQSVAKLNNCPISDRKMRLLSNSIRNMNINKAIHLLNYSSKKKMSILLKKLLLSAVNNWKNKNNIKGNDISDLYIKEIFVNGGKQLKRLKTAPQGRACRIRKRSNHITIMVDQIIKK